MGRKSCYTKKQVRFMGKLIRDNDDKTAGELAELIDKSAFPGFATAQLTSRIANMMADRVKWRKELSSDDSLVISDESSDTDVSTSTSESILSKLEDKAHSGQKKMKNNEHKKKERRHRQKATNARATSNAKPQIPSDASLFHAFLQRTGYVNGQEYAEKLARLGSTSLAPKSLLTPGENSKSESEEFMKSSATGQSPSQRPIGHMSTVYSDSSRPSPVSKKRAFEADFAVSSSTASSSSSSSSCHTTSPSTTKSDHHYQYWHDSPTKIVCLDDFSGDRQKAIAAASSPDQCNERGLKKWAVVLNPGGDYCADESSRPLPHIAFFYVGITRKPYALELKLRLFDDMMLTYDRLSDEIEHEVRLEVTQPPAAERELLIKSTYMKFPLNIPIPPGYDHSNVPKVRQDKNMWYVTLPLNW